MRTTLCTYSMCKAFSTGFQVSITSQTCWHDSVPQTCGNPAPSGVMALRLGGVHLPVSDTRRVFGASGSSRKIIALGEWSDMLGSSPTLLPFFV